MTPTRRWLPGWAKPLLRELRNAWVITVDSFARLTVVRSGNTALIVRLDAIGDFVIWLQNGAADIANELRRHHSRVVLLGNPAWAAMARELGVWDEVIPVDPDRFLRRTRYRLEILRNVRRLGLATVVQPRAARVFLLEDEIIRVCGAPTRIGSDAVLANISPRLRLRGNRRYSRVVSVPDSLEVHESVRGQAFATALCGSLGAGIPPVRLGSSPSLETTFSDPYVVIALGAGWSGRRWPVEKFAALVSQLQQSTGLRVVAVGSASDAALVEALRRSGPVQLDDRCGQLSLSESVRLIAGSRCVIANESGPMHIGIWCRVPVVGLVGGGHFGWFAPYPPDRIDSSRTAFVNFDMPCYHCNWNCQFDVPPGKAVPCVRDIPLERAVQATVRVLDAGSTRHVERPPCRSAS